MGPRARCPATRVQLGAQGREVVQTRPALCPTCMWYNVLQERKQVSRG